MVFRHSGRVEAAHTGTSARQSTGWWCDAYEDSSDAGGTPPGRVPHPGGCLHKGIARVTSPSWRCRHSFRFDTNMTSTVADAVSSSHAFLGADRSYHHHHHWGRPLIEMHLRQIERRLTTLDLDSGILIQILDQYQVPVMSLMRYFYYATKQVILKIWVVNVIGYTFQDWDILDLGEHGLLASLSINLPAHRSPTSRQSKVAYRS